MQRELVNAIMGPLLSVPIEVLVDQAIAVHHVDLVALNRAQLRAGQTAEGTAISPFYKPITVTLRQKKGLQTGFVDLYESGKFYKGIEARSAGAGKTEMDSTDPKAKFLEGKYQATIFGLSVASKEQFSQIMRPTLQGLYKQALR